MGGNNSTPKHPNQPTNSHCEWCGTSTANSIEQQQFSTCSRCGGIVNKKKNQRRRGVGESISSNSSLNSTSTAGRVVNDGHQDEKSDDINLPLQTINILPFIETLPRSDVSFTESQLLSTYLTPFFSRKVGQYIKVGMRYQIEEVDFKVVSCHPPAGILSERTKIRSMESPLHALSRVVKLHVLPTYESLKPTSSSSSSNSTSSTSLSTSSSPSSTPSVLTPPDPRALFERYLKPYFSSSDVSSHHLAFGDTFMSEGLQFKVIASAPSDGVISGETEIFTDGAPLPDLVNLTILPIFESLPNNEKNITGAQSQEKYLNPYFNGRFQLISKGEQVEIDGVSFKVVTCEPDRGLVTLRTHLNTVGLPLRADALRRQQEEEDERMARQLQEQEAKENFSPFPFPPQLSSPYPGLASAGGMLILPSTGMAGRSSLGSLGVLSGAHPYPSHAPHRRPLVGPEELRDYFATVLQRLEPNTPQREQIARLYAHLQATQNLPQNQASDAMIQDLPTREYVARKKTINNESTTNETKNEEKNESNKEHTTCMVCLCEYEDGETLRTLPCFHSYHKDCIDPWLRKNKLCQTTQTIIIVYYSLVIRKTCLLHFQIIFSIDLTLIWLTVLICLRLLIL